MTDTFLVDTNVLVRLASGDPPFQAEAAAAAMDELGQRDVRLIADAAVVAEAVYVLERSYLPGREAVGHALSQILSARGFDVQEHQEIVLALELYAATKVDFVDAYLAARAMRDGHGVVSFDKNFERFDRLDVVRPTARKRRGKS
jgi:predicted nucleic-acid-binding protein